jgi:RNA processing factor Prp31
LNNNLYEKIAERTEALKRRNEQLLEHSFNNNHLVRRPVANLLGLIELFNNQDYTDQVNALVIEKIRQSVEELDKIIIQINENLDQ